VERLSARRNQPRSSNYEHSILDVCNSLCLRTRCSRSYRRSITHHPSRPPNTLQLPPHGGVITIAIETNVDGDVNHPKLSRARHSKSRNVHARRLARELDQRFTLEAITRARRTSSPERDQSMQQSDFVENAEIIAYWEATPNVLGVTLPTSLLEIEPIGLEIVSTCL
jgi:hypothetical protein